VRRNQPRIAGAHLVEHLERIVPHVLARVAEQGGQLEGCRGVPAAGDLLGQRDVRRLIPVAQRTGESFEHAHRAARIPLQ